MATQKHPRLINNTVSVPGFTAGSEIHWKGSESAQRRCSLDVREDNDGDCSIERHPRLPRMC